MVCTANDLLGWRDFPKGLRVLLLDEDSNSASEIRSKLEGMDYVVSTFSSEDDALSAISDNSKCFHVAIIEVGTANCEGRFKFLEMAKDLPTVMTSHVNCLSIMMKCISLGAVEFLKKPLCEEKLGNLWQHVVHKAFNGGGKDLSASLKPIKESVVSILQLQVEDEEPKKKLTVETVNTNDQVSPKDEEELHPGPSTPQIRRGRSLVDREVRESTEQVGESKSVETTSGNLISEKTIDTSPSERVLKNEDESADVSKSESNVSPHPSDQDGSADFVDEIKGHNEVSTITKSRGTRANRRKVDWTPELRKKFVQAVELLGMDQAIPSRILELMNVEGLTRHNVASHLQKYRIQRRHVLPKESERRWPQTRDTMQRNHYLSKHVVSYTPCPAWVPPSNYPSQIWGQPYYPAWQSTEAWQWSPYLGLQADSWGCPAMPQPVRPYSPFFPNTCGFQISDSMQNSRALPTRSYDIYPAEEVLDKVVKEAINKPWLPLPLGLKPPSTESVLSELSKQGIPNIPPPSRAPR